jgi:hypothetical protein
MYKCVDSSLTDLFISSWYPSHIDLCCIKVSVLVPLWWASNTIMFWVSYLSPYLSYVLSPYHVTQVVGSFLTVFSFFWYWGLNSGPSPWATPPALFLWRVFQDRVSQNYLPRLTSNCYPPDLYHLSSYDYRREPPASH